MISVKMEYAIVFGFIVLLICGIAKFASSKDYANMTEEQFEVEKERASMIARPISAL